MFILRLPATLIHGVVLLSLTSNVLSAPLTIDWLARIGEGKAVRMTESRREAR